MTGNNAKVLTFAIKQGILFDSDGKISAAYAGAPGHVNNPDDTRLIKLGPLPVGRYYIGKPYDKKTTGPYSIPLAAFLDNEMFNRGGFFIHGDNIKHPGTASEGCIIANPAARHLIVARAYDYLEVIASNA